VAEAATIVRLTQEEGYRFRATFEGPTVPPETVDEPDPTGAAAGPDAVQLLALAVGHCMSSTLHACFERSHVAVRPISTEVRPILGRNARGRLRVVRLEVAIDAQPVDEADRPKVARCLAVFEDLCPVTGAVREGAAVVLTATGPPTGSPG
jgi:uncharacterized OsmC-like protein